MPQWLFELDEKLLRILDASGPLDRTELTRRTGVPRSTLYGHLIRLCLCGAVIKHTKKNGGRGRPKTLWSINHYPRKTKG